MPEGYKTHTTEILNKKISEYIYPIIILLLSIISLWFTYRPKALMRNYKPRR